MNAFFKGRHWAQLYFKHIGDDNRNMINGEQLPLPNIAMASTSRKPPMRAFVFGLLAASTLVSGCTTTGYGGNRGSGTYANYDYNRPDPAYNGYEADRYYRENARYRERVLSANDRVYRGRDGRYYCRRDDGTTGLIVGGIAGGILGNIIAPGGSGLIGTLLGAAGGAVAGQAIDKSGSKDARCR